MAVASPPREVNIADLPGSLPRDNLPFEPDLESAAHALKAHLTLAPSDGFVGEALWRDFLALTDGIRTLADGAHIANVWERLSSKHNLVGFQTTQQPIRRQTAGSTWIDVSFTFRTQQLPARNCAGIASLVHTDSRKWKIWVLRTWLENFRGHGHPDQPVYLDQSTNPAAQKNGATLRHHNVGAVIVGAGQNGLATAGRLQALGISYLLLEQNAQVGVNWTSKYDYMKWNTPKEFGNLPFDRTFKESDPEWLSASHIAAGYRRYVDKYRINIWLSATLAAPASYDPTTHVWTVPVLRFGRLCTIECNHLILTTGVSGNTPSYPSIPNRSGFKGSVRHALDGYRSAKPWAGKSGIVLGVGNTGMDTAQDMWENGIDVTIVQRGKTLVMKRDNVATAMKHLNAELYNRDVSTATADRIGFTWPTKVSREMTNASTHPVIAEDAHWYEQLESRGLKCDRPGDIINLLSTRLGGYYYDCGTCDHILNGNIKMKSDSQVRAFTHSGLSFEDGTQIDADVVVFATGYEADHRQSCATLVGKGVARQLEDLWGLDSEGELRGLYKECRGENPVYRRLWLVGGDTRRARWFSRFVALQIQTDMLGVNSMYTEAKI